jgi:hypothetical protein
MKNVKLVLCSILIGFGIGSALSQSLGQWNGLGVPNGYHCNVTSP